MSKSNKYSSLECSFCHKGKPEIRDLIAGPGVYICNECIGIVSDIVSDRVEMREAYKEPVKPRVLVDFKGAWQGKNSALQTHKNNIQAYFGVELTNKRRRRATKKGA